MPIVVFEVGTKFVPKVQTVDKKLAQAKLRGGEFMPPELSALINQYEYGPT